MLAQEGASIVSVELPERITGEADEEVAETVVRLAARLVERGAAVRDDLPGWGEKRVTGEMIGVVCAHVSQVNAVRERLPASLSGVFVETADRFQGLERPIMLVHHPLSGRADADTFHLDAGRLCVMLSRHRIACFVVGRAGMEDLLLRYAPSGDRVLGIDEDEEFEGWRAHLSFLQSVRREGRVLSV
jgi:superfamily I DNA and/or RNA helicase